MGWFLPGHDTPLSSPDLTVASRIACSPDGAEIAFSDPASAHKIFVGIDGNYKAFAADGLPSTFVFSSDGKMLYFLIYRDDGQSSLYMLQRATGQIRVVADHLDMSVTDPSITLSPDNQYAYLALASPGIPDNRARAMQGVDRWLKIYRMNLSTGERRLLVDSPGQDNTAPIVEHGSLYWTRTFIQDTIVTVPADGGSAKEVIAEGELPMWNPSGSKIGYFFGGIRLADQPLNLDAATVNVDAAGNRISEPQPIIVGYHEDFSPAWSPDGKWIAYHSHRSPTPVGAYTSPGSTDDVYLRKADDLHAPEIRLTDFGWEAGPAFWSPDGHKLLFFSYKRGGTAGINKLFVISVDTERGAALKTEMLPLPEAVHNVRWAAWSPDGKEIAIEDDQGSGKRILWVARTDGTHLEKLSDYMGTSYDGLDWTRDGKSIVYSRLSDAGTMQIFSIPRSGGVTRQLTHDFGNLLHPKVSPDGRRIACTRMLQSKQLWQRPAK